MTPAEGTVGTLAGRPAVPAGFTVSLRNDDRLEAGLVSWRTRWVLRWQPVPGAVDYLVYVGTSEGVTPGAPPRRVVTVPELGMDTANGISAPERLELDRRTQLAFAASHVMVSVAARDAAGREGERSPWIPVGEVPASGVPVGRATAGH